MPLDKQIDKYAINPLYLEFVNSSHNLTIRYRIYQKPFIYDLWLLYILLFLTKKYPFAWCKRAIVMSNVSYAWINVIKKKIAKNAINTAPVIVSFFNILSLDLPLFFFE